MTKANPFQIFEFGKHFPLGLFNIKQVVSQHKLNSSTNLHASKSPIYLKTLSSLFSLLSTNASKCCRQCLWTGFSGNRLSVSVLIILFLSPHKHTYAACAQQINKKPNSLSWFYKQKSFVELFRLLLSRVVMQPCSEVGHNFIFSFKAKSSFCCLYFQPKCNAHLHPPNSHPARLIRSLFMFPAVWRLTAG